MALRLPSPSLVVLVGPSGAGKTTWARSHFAPNQIVSSDALRAVVGAGEDDQAAGTVAFDLLERIVAERMRRGLTTVVDTLGYDAGSRARWRALARDAGVPSHAVLFPASLETCLAGNAGRERPLPITAIRRQVSRFGAVRAEVESEDFSGVHSTEPVHLVTPAIAEATRQAQDELPTASQGHSFGLLVSRFDWEGDDLVGRLAAVARRAETAGFRDLWVMDHFRQIRGVGRPWEDMPEAYVSLGYVAGVTETIRLGALVTAITHRHPVVLGKMVATLDVLSGGRAMCGLGLGWDEDEHESYGIPFPGRSERYELLEETLQMLPLLWGPGTPAFHGRHIDAERLYCYPRPLQEPIPVLVAGSGEKKTLRIVARHAGAANVFGDPERVEHKAEVLRRHCADLGRDPGEVELTHLVNVLAAADRDGVREKVERLRDRNTTAEEYMRRHNAGTTGDLISLFARYHQAGATHSIVVMPDVSVEGSLEVFADVIAAHGPS